MSLLQAFYRDDWLHTR